MYHYEHPTYVVTKHTRRPHLSPGGGELVCNTNVTSAVCAHDPVTKLNVLSMIYLNQMCPVTGWRSRWRSPSNSWTWSTPFRRLTAIIWTVSVAIPVSSNGCRRDMFRRREWAVVSNGEGLDDGRSFVVVSVSRKNVNDSPLRRSAAQLTALSI